jgi:putative acetyltransferase
MTAPTIRPEAPGDYAAVADITEVAFGRPVEARMIEAIRDSPGYVPELSLVAEEDGEVVGHVIVSYVNLEDGRRLLELGPIAVRPERQGQGIGGMLVGAGLAAADALGEPLVLLLGHPTYYPRFGFVSASALGLLPPNPDLLDAAWMVCPLQAYTPDIRGRVVFPDWFPDEASGS